MLSTASPPPVLPGKRLEIPAHDPLKLDSGASLGPLTLAYQTYGTLDLQRANAVMVCHAPINMTSTAIRAPAGWLAKTL